MMPDVPFPSLAATEEKGQVEELRRYLYRLATYLRDASPDAMSAGLHATAQNVKTGERRALTEREATDTFLSLKGLLLTSAELVEHFAMETERRLTSHYVGSGTFGSYREDMEQRVSESAARTDALFTSLQRITSEVTGLENVLIEVSARLRTGLLCYAADGAPVYGLEIGQRNTVGGEETFQKYARFTADRLSFYDRNGTEVAYIGDYRLYITSAEVTGDLKVGGYRLHTDNGLAFRWEGGSV